jgi:thiol-disulfide isomerase/thioredoxin
MGGWWSLMPIIQVEFTELEKRVMETKRRAIDLLAKDFGKAYVVAITRDGCPACERQKPKLNELAKTLSKKHGDKLAFIRIHINQAAGDTTESMRAKDVFNHYFYPTNLILYRTEDRGAIEFYRNVAPRMSELRRNTEIVLKVVAGS